MTGLISRRTLNSGLFQPRFERPEAVVSWMGAVQSQDYPGAAWGLARRTRTPADAPVHEAFDAGRILRTHILRPTWHFVAPADLRWMLALSGPRVQVCNRSLYRSLSLDARTLARGHSIIARALEGRNWQTRADLAAALERGGIRASGIRLAYLVMHAELDGLICSGPRRGRQFTYALLDERAPSSPPLDRETALRELARRYLRSHGPATVWDFSWWSGLTMRDAAAGFASIDGEVTREVEGGLTYWFMPGPRPRPRRGPAAYLLPNYDEYLIAFRDRRLITSDAPRGVKDRYPYHLIVDSRLAGCWRPRAGGREVVVEVATYRRPTASEKAAIAAEAGRYGRFRGLPARLSLGLC
jgi:hypothetical protein